MYFMIFWPHRIAWLTVLYLFSPRNKLGWFNLGGWHLIESLSGGKVWAQTRLRTTTRLLSSLSQEGIKMSLMPVPVKSNNWNAVMLLIFATKILNKLSILHHKSWMAGMFLKISHGSQECLTILNNILLLRWIQIKRELNNCDKYLLSPN